MQSGNELVARYRKYFEKWDVMAAVRSKPNDYRLIGNLDTELKCKRWFIPAGLLILNHPLMKNIDLDQEQYLLGRFLLQFLEYGTLMEHEFINTILAELALGECAIEMPDEMRQDAFKIYTDEGYHACFNMQATQQIRQYIGMSTSDSWPLKNTRLTGLRNLVSQYSDKEKFLIRFGIAAVSETVAPKELAENMKGIVVDSIYNIFVDHAEDEKKHCMYFSVLWEVVWKYLSPEERKFLGTNLPKILRAFVDINTIPLFDALDKIGVDSESAKTIIKESYPSDFTVQRAISVASVSFRIFDRLKIYDVPEIKNAFIQNGFIQAA